jgi:hypothetical protein
MVKMVVDTGGGVGPDGKQASQFIHTVYECVRCAAPSQASVLPRLVLALA